MEVIQPWFMNSGVKWRDSSREEVLWKSTTMISKVYGGKLISTILIQCNVRKILNTSTTRYKRIKCILFLIILEDICCSLNYFPRWNSHMHMSAQKCMPSCEDNQWWRGHGWGGLGLTKPQTRGLHSSQLSIIKWKA